MASTIQMDADFQRLKTALQFNQQREWEVNERLTMQVNALEQHQKSAFVSSFNQDLAGQATVETLFTLPEYWINEDVVGRRSLTIDADITLSKGPICCGLMKVSVSFWRSKGHWYCAIDFNLIAVLSTYRNQGVGSMLVEQGMVHYVNPLIISCFTQITHSNTKLDVVFSADYLNQASKKLGQLAFDYLEAIDIELSARSFLVDLNKEFS
ncbi:hypothetical protein [Thaumasiovibrio sp. DFM-14]|uniref:hypothetical protein n=1 Tax=Thaumasiovibrio sp. DFM-14 TaxID=3384792 RepID=UPI0039A1B34D